MAVIEKTELATSLEQQYKSGKRWVAYQNLGFGPLHYYSDAVEALSFCLDTARGTDVDKRNAIFYVFTPIENVLVHCGFLNDQPGIQHIDQVHINRSLKKLQISPAYPQSMDDLVEVLSKGMIGLMEYKCSRIPADYIEQYHLIETVINTGGQAGQKENRTITSFSDYETAYKAMHHEFLRVRSDGGGKSFNIVLAGNFRGLALSLNDMGNCDLFSGINFYQVALSGERITTKFKLSPFEKLDMIQNAYCRFNPDTSKIDLLDRNLNKVDKDSTMCSVPESLFDGDAGRLVKNAEKALYQTKYAEKFGGQGISRKSI